MIFASFREFFEFVFVIAFMILGMVVFMIVPTALGANDGVGLFFGFVGGLAGAPLGVKLLRSISPDPNENLVRFWESI